jgi:prephenate dehydrogenase
MSWLPERFEAVGGHPMCGKETSSIRSADPLLYQGAPFALCETARTTPRARQAAEAVARACGAHPLWLDPAQHDRWVAYTSHAPYLLACALAEAVPQEASPMIGPGFRGMTRLAASSPRMMADIHATNAAQIRAALRTIIERLEAYDSLIQAGSPQVLEETFRRAQAESQARSAPARTA